MRKLLSILGSVGMLGTAGITVVSCGEKSSETPPTVDKTKLKATINEATVYLSEVEDKSEEEKEGFQREIDTAQSVHDKSEATQEEINSADGHLKISLEIFKGNLWIDKSALEIVIDDAKTLISNSKKSNEVTEKLKTAITVAQTIVDNEYSNQAEVDAGVVTLKAEITTFTEAPDVVIDKKQLESIIEKAKSLLASNNKPKPVVSALESAIEIAETVLKDQNVTQETVNNATDELNQAIKSFEKAANLGDKTELIAKVAEAQNLLEGSSKSAEVDNKLDKAIDEVKKTVDFEDADADEVKEKMQMLEKAIRDFEDAPNLTGRELLGEMIDKANELIKNVSPDKEWKIKNLQLVIEEAKTIFENEDAPTKEIGEAISGLKYAIIEFRK